MASNQLEQLKETWQREQNALKAIHTVEDRIEWTLTENRPNTLKYVAGMDISFIKGNPVDACAMLVVLAYPSLTVVYKKSNMVKLTVPYISGYLAFREAPHFEVLLDELERDHPEYYPQVILMDGNGVLHPRGMGIATHLGLVMDIPTFGVAKSLLCFDGLEPNSLRTEFKQQCPDKGDVMPVRGHSGNVYGYAFNATGKGTHPIYISSGHRISLDTSLKLVRKLCPYRIPEPIRQADLGSREAIRQFLAAKP